jgi:hypothetical protein
MRPDACSTPAYDRHLVRLSNVKLRANRIQHSTFNIQHSTFRSLVQHSKVFLSSARFVIFRQLDASRSVEQLLRKISEGHRDLRCMYRVVQRTTCIRNQILERLREGESDRPSTDPFPRRKSLSQRSSHPSDSRGSRGRRRALRTPASAVSDRKGAPECDRRRSGAVL